MSRAYPGDEVYFHRNGTPCIGKVLAAGKHGCTIDHEGARHKVKWHHVRGHHKRTPQAYKVLHQGEDGVIVENQHGKRRFLNVGMEARAERYELGEQKMPAGAKGSKPAIP